MMHLGDHLAWLRASDFRPSTIKQRGDTCRRFAKATGETLTSANRQVITEWLGAYPDPSTRQSYLAHLAAYYRWAVNVADIQSTDPTVGVPRPKVRRRLPDPIADADLELAIAQAPSDNVRAWLTLSGFAGLRACEIAPIRGEDIRRDRTPFLYIPEQKGGHPGTVPLSSRVLAELDRWPTQGWLWKPSGPHVPTYVSHAVSAYLKELLGPRARLHQGRHRFATVALRAAGGDLRRTQELMRHGSPQTTALYTRIDPADLASLAELVI